MRFLLCRDGAEELLPLAGSDLGSLEGLRATFANAVQYPGTLASEPLRLPHATGRHHLLAMRAVRDLQEPQALRGFLVCAIDPQRLLFSAQPPHSFPGRDLEVELLALMPDAPPRRLAVDRARPISLRTGMTRADASDSLLIRPILAFGRAYGVATRPTPVWMAHHTSPLAWMVLFIGLAGTAGAVGKLRGSVHQRRAMEALVEQRTRDLTATMQRYQVLTETMRDVVWILDPETFRFLYVSPAVEPLLGFSVQEVMSWPIDAIVFPEDRDGLRGMIRMRLDNFRAGRSSHLTFFVNEITHRRKDGSALPTETVSRYCWNVETGAIELHGVSRDITERKRTQVYRDLTVATLQILNQPADFDELLQQIADALAEKTGCNRGVGIRMKAHDDYPFAAVSGMNAEALRHAAGLAVRDKDGVPRFDEEGRPLLHCVCGMVLGGQTHPGISFFTEGGSCWTNDLRELAHLPVPAFDGCACERDAEGSLALVPIRNQNEIIGLIQLRDRRTGMFSLEIVEILEDIASHLGAALLRKRVERDYRLLFHGMLEGFAIQEVLFDDAGAPADFRFLAVNPAFERLSGFSARDTLGKTLGAIEPDLLPFWIESCGRAATEGEPVNFVWYAARERRFIEVAAFRPAPRQIACLFTDVTERIQADRELRESQRQYKSLLAHLQGMVYRCTYDADWTMEFVSDGALALTGFGPDDLIRNRTIPFLTLVLPQNRDRLLDRREEAIRGRRVFDIEYEIVTRDRKVKWVLEQGGGVYDDQGRCVAVEGFITDITERRNAARELERLMAAIEQSGETVMITDASGVIQYVNLAFERITGYTRAEALGHTPRMLKSGVHDAASYRHLWETILGGRMWKGEFVNRTKTGTLYTESVSITPVCSDAGEVVNFVAVRRDITEEKKAAAELAESEYRYRTLADSGTTLIWTSRRDKQCDWFNRPWLDFTGRTLEQELGDGWTESISPEDRDRYLGAYAAAFDRNEPFSIEFRLRHADGGYRWVVTRGTPRFDLAGSFLGYIAHSMDISDLKRAEAEREKIQEQFVQAQKMESIGRLAGGVAHDFNNMLQAILGYTDLALEELAPDKPPVQELLEIQKAAQRSSALTHRLQAFARKQPIAARELDLNECVEGMLNMLRRLIGESIALQWKPGAGLHAVCMDPGQIDQVVVNLCVNARDAIGAHGAGGRIVLETANREVASADTDIHREIVPGSYVMLSVSDNGSGIAHADVVRIFEPFFTTKPKGAGTGLGLSTVYGIVRQNKGGIQVLSAPGEGTTFQIFFPRHAGADSPSERAEDSLA
ncbi:MAG: PAS domain S-box protein, partial [Burkholderiaceae bacterium]|nr:PAS domain S-box protein [Burkholderiaceae bacterium]